MIYRKTMKILHVLETSLPNLVGYTIRAKYIVENQRLHGLDPVVVTSPFFRNGNPEIRLEEINEIKYYRTNHIRKPDSKGNKMVSLWTRFRMIQRYKKAVLDIAKKEKPDIIHAHSSYTNGHAANYVSRKLGIPSIYELRSLWGESAVVEDGLSPNSFKYKMVWMLELRAMKEATRVIAISQGIKDEIVLKGIDAGKIDIVPNGVDTTIFQPQEKDTQLLNELRLDDAFVVGYIGSIRKLEGLSLLLNAFQMINQKNPKIKVLIVGNGPERKALQEKAQGLNLQGVVFTGEIPHSEILKYYSAIDLFVFPRINAKINQAVTPLKPLEAMAVGKVCLCSNVGGLTELIKDDYNGMVFNIGDADDLAYKILSISADKVKYTGLRKNGLDWVIRERDWSALIPRYREIYKNALEEKPRR